MKAIKPKLSLLNVILLSVFSVVILSACSTKKESPAVTNIKQIQAYTDLCFYGQKLTKVEITYNENVDLSNITSDSYSLLDRGYANPDFDAIIIESVDVNGQQVTLNITKDTEALETNALIYSGDNAT